MEKYLTWYLAGPMSWIPQFNVPLFHSVSADLRGKGYTIISPAEKDSPKMQAAALASPDGDLSKLEKDTNETWGQVLGKDVELVADHVGGIVFLPNWWNSSGAKLEAFVGLLKGKKFAYYQPKGVWDVNIDGLAPEAYTIELSAEQVRATLRRFI